MSIRSDLRRAAADAGVHIDNDHPGYHEDDPAEEGKAIERQEYGINNRLIPRQIVRKKEVGHGFPEEDDHDADPHDGPEDVFTGGDRTHRADGEERINQPDRERPQEGDERDPAQSLSAREFRYFHGVSFIVAFNRLENKQNPKLPIEYEDVRILSAILG